jgi:hypothetical protein
MRKADDLKAFLLDNVPELKKTPERLTIFLEGGSVGCTSTSSMSFEWSYTAKVSIQDYAGDPDHIMVPVLAWLARHQPERLNPRGDSAFAFDAEILDGDKADLELSIVLTEPVIVTPGDDGYTALHVGDPEDDDGFGPGVWQLFLRDQFLGETTDPDFPNGI